MLAKGRLRGLMVRAALLVLATNLVVAERVAAAPTDPARPGRSAKPPSVTGLGPVAQPKLKPPAPLPKKKGSVTLRSPKRVTTPKSTPSPTTSPEGPVLFADPGEPAYGKVALRALVLAADQQDFGIATWQATLDRIGAAYDVLPIGTTPLTEDSLVRPDGVGRYNAILLTNSMLFPSSGGFTSVLDATEWNVLWQYERDYLVRQVALYTSHGTWPENYCLQGVSEGSVGDTPVVASLTTAGAGVFDYLNASAQIPITQSYLYRTSIAAGCAADPVLTAGSDVVGVRSTSTDGRERIALTFTSNQYLSQANLLVYGLVRWATKGLFLGEQRHYLNIDIDDWLNTADHYYPDGHVEADPGYRPSPADAVNLAARQNALRASYPLASDLTYNLAYNGGDLDPVITGPCAPDGTSVNLTATTRCLANQFRWINHTMTHQELNLTDYATSYTEIAANRAVATALGLADTANVLKTGEYSGLGVYNDDPNDDLTPPTDRGLAASNPNLLAAARDLGVQYLHGNMSFNSHVPACFNCGVVHPLESAVTIVPDYPTNIAYHTTTPDEQIAFYNSFYGPTGRFPYWPQNLTYQQMLAYETDVAVNRVATGAINSNTFHIANVRDYGSGQTLLTDWTEQVLAKYSALYAVPLLNLDWSTLGARTSARLAHFGALSAGVDAVYDRTAGTVTVSAPAAGTVVISGAQVSGAETYGTDVFGAVTLTAGTPVTFTPVLRA